MDSNRDGFWPPQWEGNIFYIFCGLFCQIRVQIFRSDWQLHLDIGIYQGISLLCQNFFFNFVETPKQLEIYLCLINNYFYYESTVKYPLIVGTVFPPNIIWDLKLQFHALCVNINFTSRAWYCFWSGGETAANLDPIFYNTQETSWSQSFSWPSLSAAQHI